MIVVTAPTGTIGRQVVEHILRTSEPARLIARDPSKLPPAVRARFEVVQGSHCHPDVLDRAFAGADAVFWLVPPDPGAASVDAAYLDFTRPAVGALERHRVKRVVGISALGLGTPWADRAGLVTASLKMDELLAAGSAAYRAVANPSFMDNLLRQLDAIRNHGVFYLPIDGDLKQPSACSRDIAEVAARWLLDPSWSGSGRVPVLGPEDLSYNDMARTMSEVLGRPVRFQRISGDAFKARLLERGMSEAMAQANVEMWNAYDHGLDLGERRTSEATTPTTFRQWCEEVLGPRLAATAAAPKGG